MQSIRDTGRILNNYSIRAHDKRAELVKVFAPGIFWKK